MSYFCLTNFFPFTITPVGLCAFGFISGNNNFRVGDARIPSEQKKQPDIKYYLLTISFHHIQCIKVIYEF